VFKEKKDLIRFLFFNSARQQYNSSTEIVQHLKKEKKRKNYSLFKRNDYDYYKTLH
jgi:hypothetical protein